MVSHVWDSHLASRRKTKSQNSVLEERNRRLLKRELTLIAVLKEFFFKCGKKIIFVPKPWRHPVLDVRSLSQRLGLEK